MTDILTGTVTNGERVAVDLRIWAHQPAYTGLAGLVRDADSCGGTIAVPRQRPMKMAKRDGPIDGRPARINAVRECDVDPKNMTIATFVFTDEAGA